MHDGLIYVDCRLDLGQSFAEFRDTGDRVGLLGDIEYICCFPQQKHNKVFGMLESLEMLELYLDLALKEAFGIHNKVFLLDGGIYNLRSNELSQRYLHLFHSYLGLIRMFYKTLFRYK